MEWVRKEKKMPIYEFRCKTCGNVFESLCFHSDGEDKCCCPTCGEDESEKVFSIFSCGASGVGDVLSDNTGPSACASKEGFS